MILFASATSKECYLKLRDVENIGFSNKTFKKTVRTFIFSGNALKKKNVKEK
jgi:hypothetical protein